MQDLLVFRRKPTGSRSVLSYTIRRLLLMIPTLVILIINFAILRLLAQLLLGERWQFRQRLGSGTQPLPWHDRQPISISSPPGGNRN